MKTLEELKATLRGEPSDTPPESLIGISPALLERGVQLIESQAERLAAAEAREAGLREALGKLEDNWDSRSIAIYANLPGDSTPEKLALSHCRVSEAACLAECAGHVREVLAGEEPS